MGYVTTSRPMPALVLLRGDEQLLVDRAIARVLAAVREVDPDTERRESGAAGLTPGEFHDLVAPSLFEEPRVIVIRGAHEATKELAAAIAEYCAAPVAGITLVVHHAGGARNKPLADGVVKAGASVVECVAIKRASDRIAFVRAEIKAAGGNTNPAAAAALVDALGADLAELASAASQLVSDSGGVVDEAAVRRYYRGRAGMSGFVIAELAVAGNIAGALEALRWALIMGEPELRIADALASEVRTVAKVAGSLGASSQQIAAQWGMPPWKADKVRTTAKGWTASGLVAAMQMVTLLNAQVKGGAADNQYALEHAVIEIGRARRAG